MTPILTLISATRYIDLPRELLTWLGLAALAAMILFFQWIWRGYNRKISGMGWALPITLLILTPLTSLFIGAQLSDFGGLPPPGMPRSAAAPVVMLFSALPWMLAGGMLGPLPAALLAFFNGLLTAYFNTHNPFTPLEMALLATLFSAAVRQSYRTPTYRLLRIPPAAAAATAAAFIFIHLIFTPLIATPTSAVSEGLRLVTRLDYALTNLAGMSLAVAIELMIAGLIVQSIVWLAPRHWPVPTRLEPSPAERSLRMRFIVSMAPLALTLIFGLLVGNWIVANAIARNMLESQISGAARAATGGVPYFLETGQNLIQSMAADPELLSVETEDLGRILAGNLRSTPFFNQLSVLDQQGNAIASFPTRFNVGRDAPSDVQMGVQAVFNGMPFQAYTVPPATGQSTAQVAFIAAINDQTGATSRVLVGHSDLATNPFIQPTLSGLDSLDGIDGQWLLIDENRRILAHSESRQVWEFYDGELPAQADTFDDTAADGTRRIVHYQPIDGRPWAVLVFAPAYQVQQVAMNISLPMVLIIIVLALIALVVVLFSLGGITRSLQDLATEAGRLAEGRLDRPVTYNSTDEVGRLSRAFEQMRMGLKARLDELNRLLTVSQGVASSLEFSEAVQPVLESALGGGADAARVALTPAMMPELNGASSGPISFGAGPMHQQYAHLDEQILAQTRQQDRLVLSNLYRPRLLNFTPGAARPESLIAVALRHENQYYGSLWVAYDQPHTFSEEEVRFLATLGGQAALAAANARLFLSAEIGRKRLESILASTPDPVLVTDQHNCLLLANPAAWDVLALNLDNNEGRPIDQVVTDSGLLNLLHTGSEDQSSIEVLLPAGKVYLASATAVIAEGRPVGRICVMRDITHLKELDALKSEFVSTVSHDLRAPLTLMRGYATMLEMVGQLNDQQIGYVRKIVSGVERMSRLVNNLLDLGRIEAGVGLQLETVPVVDVVERAVGALQLQAAQKNITLTLDTPGHTMPLIEADQALFEQALQNLIENAIKFTRPKGKVMVRVQVQPVGVVVQVIDNGAGISPMDMPRLFEKFYRGAQQGGNKEERGTGLGLAIVRSFAERHGGRVWAESRLGQGSVFYLSLPLKQSKTATDNTAKSAG